MVYMYLNLLGLLLSVKSGAEARKTSGDHCRLSNMTIVKMLFRGGNHCTNAHYCIKYSIFAHWVLDESGDFVYYSKTVFIAFYGKVL